MTDGPDTLQVPPTVARRARRYRLAGVVILLLGLAGAGVVYWLGTRSAILADDAAMTGFNRATERQMALLYGKQGRFVEDLTNWLKQPGTQAILIVAAAVVVAGAVFFLARILEEEAKDAAASGSRPPGP